MTTARTINRLIRAVLIDGLNVYGPGESIDAVDAQTVLYAIQDRLSAWVDHVIIPITITESFAMTAGTGSYTLGETGSPTLTTVRPEKILGGYVRQGNYDYPVNVIPETSYRSIVDKTTTGRPTELYPDYKTPNITIYLSPIPDSTDNLYLTSLKQMTEPTSYTQDTFVDLGIPPLVYNALKYRVMIDVAPSYQRQVSQEVGANAADAYSKLIAMNLSKRMQGGYVELAYANKKARYSLSDFFAGV